MKTNISIIHFAVMLFVLTITFSSCKDVFEEDLAKKTVTINSPQNGLQTTNSTEIFWWEPVEGAIKYNLQIVSPTFLNTQKLVLDTNVTVCKFEFTLTPGLYEWRVKAFNSSSYTPFVTYSLQVDSTANLSNQQIVLISPGSSFVTNHTSVKFSWYSLYNADDYRFELRTSDWNGSLAINPIITTYDTLTLTLEEGTYAWGVQAHNITSNSPFSTRVITIDLTDPNTPLLNYPANNITVNDSILTASTIIFGWFRGVNTGSAIHDSLYIATDSLFSTIFDSTVLTDTTYSKPFTTAGSYFWKIRSYDIAGNKSSYSVTRKFTYEK
jgi:hypothetical protein